MGALKALARCGAVATAAVVLTVIAARPRRVEVEGPSMLSALAPGDRLIVARLRRLRPGDIVALHDPQEPSRLLVKRVASVGPAGVQVRGDNELFSRDSRRFGPVAPSSIVGVALYRYFPPGRTGFSRQFGASGGTLDLDGPA